MTYTWCICISYFRFEFHRKSVSGEYTYVFKNTDKIVVDYILFTLTLFFHLSFFIITID